MINILICVNKAYLDKAKTMLFSMREHTKEEITVWMLNKSLTEFEIQPFREYLSKKCNINLNVVDASALPLSNINLDILSIEMYYRIFAQWLLPQDLDKILWLDADIILMRDVKELYDLPFDGAKYLVCEDGNAHKSWFAESIAHLNLPSDHKYFNSGVLLINIQELRKGKSLEELLHVCEEMKDVVLYPDQDILNTLYAGEVKHIEWRKYNYQMNCRKCIEKEYLNDVVVLHYVGNKPWDYRYINSASKYYWKTRVKQGHTFEPIIPYLRKALYEIGKYFNLNWRKIKKYWHVGKNKIIKK